MKVEDRMVSCYTIYTFAIAVCVGRYRLGSPTLSGLTALRAVPARHGATDCVSLEWFAGSVSPRKTPEEYYALAEGRGFRWLGPAVPNVKTKTSWQCAEGHEWGAVYDSVARGTGCPFCAGIAPKTPDDYNALAEERGFQWLGPEVVNIQTRTSWECDLGHAWQATYGSIQQGSGCPVCAGKLPKQPADYHALAEELGFRWLGPEVPNVRTRTGWECREGHCWDTTYDNIRSGRGCPICGKAIGADKRRTRPAAYHAVAKKRGFRWLGPEVPTVREKTGWECEKGHHWQASFDNVRRGRGCPYCANKVPLTPDDYHSLTESRGFEWLGPEVPNNSTKTGWRCEHGHEWQANYSNIQQGTGCPFCWGKIPVTPEDYKILAEERGFRWLGPEVPNARTATRWECELGHQWETTYNKIQQGTGCPICAIDLVAEQRRTKPSEYHALAEERGFKWLGPEVRSVLEPTWWECEQGHRWRATYGNMYHQGTGCPECIDMVHGARVSQLQRDLCEMLGGELNKPFGVYCIDIALEVSDTPVAVEYDAWYWHAGREENDAQRDGELIAAGWRVLRVRSNMLLPTRKQLDVAIGRLLKSEQRVEIVLDDWGLGPTRFGVE